MYRGWTRDRAFGGELQMKYLALILALVSVNAFACWNLKAELQTGDKRVSLNQKFDHDKTYSFPSGPYIFNVKMPSKKNRPASMPDRPGTHLVIITVDEKQGTSLKEVATGMILVKADQEATMTVSKTENALVDSKFIVKVSEI